MNLRALPWYFQKPFEPFLRNKLRKNTIGFVFENNEISEVTLTVHCLT